MEHLFNTIQTAIAEGMPDLTLVDEDYGQLQTEEDTYPVTFPCVLIGIDRFKRLHDIVRLLDPAGATPLDRTSSRWFSLPGAIKVYESTYECIIDEEPA